MRIHATPLATRCLAALAATILAISTFATSTVTTQAADRTGTLTITPKVGDTVITSSDYDGTFKVYQVADYTQSGTFTATEDFQFDNHETLLASDNLSDEGTFKEITQTITAWLNAHSGIAATLSGVKAGAQNSLPYGLYLICQDTSASKYNDTTPFLVMIPHYDDGKTENDVTAYPKVSKTSKPHDDTPPTTPKKTGKVAFGKSDAVTGKALEGVTFILYKKDGTAVGTYVTDAEGVIYVDHLPYGGYYFVEVQALDGYILDETPQDFKIADEDTVLVTMTNQPVEETPETPEDIGGFTGDNSQMLLYGAVVVAAAAALIGWFVWKRRSEKAIK